jgi:hypothetical protein
VAGRSTGSLDVIVRSGVPGFIVLYRWKLHPGTETAFVDAWSGITEQLRKFGSLGSRLHRGPDQIWYGYAQWPDEETRRKAFEQHLDTERSAKMRAAILETLPEIQLQCIADYLIQPCT